MKVAIARSSTARDIAGVVVVDAAMAVDRGRPASEPSRLIRRRIVTRIRSAPGAGFTWRLAQGWTRCLIRWPISIAAAGSCRRLAASVDLELLGVAPSRSITPPSDEPRGCARRSRPASPRCRLPTIFASAPEGARAAAWRVAARAVAGFLSAAAWRFRRVWARAPARRGCGLAGTGSRLRARARAARRLRARRARAPGSARAASVLRRGARPARHRRRSSRPSAPAAAAAWAARATPSDSPADQHDMDRADAPNSIARPRSNDGARIALTAPP